MTGQTGPRQAAAPGQAVAESAATSPGTSPVPGTATALGWRARWGRPAALAVATLHYALVPYVLLAWLWAQPIWLLLHLIFVPVMVGQWLLNRNVCILSNLESWLRDGHWWQADDPGQGGWVAGIFTRLLGAPPAPWQTSALLYTLLLGAWSASLWRLLSL